MRTLDIPTRLLSEVVWQRLLESSASRFLVRRQDFSDLIGKLDSLRQSADSPTGSISIAAAWTLYSLSYYFRPRRMLEVGTYIGRSTLALALGADDAGIAAELHTCDASNAIELPRASKCPIHQYPRTSSTDMLRKLSAGLEADSRFELVFLDGKLRKEDPALLQTICVSDVVVALDDFEGLEKGVVNYSNLRDTKLLSSHHLIYPCSEFLLHKFGFAGHSNIALLIPQSSVRMTAQ